MYLRLIVLSYCYVRNWKLISYDPNSIDIFIYSYLLASQYLVIIINNNNNNNNMYNNLKSMTNQILISDV